MLTNSEDPDEMHAAEWGISSGSTLFAEVKTIILGTEIHHNLENSTCDPINTQWAVPYLLYQYIWENSTRIQRVNKIICNL